MNILFIHRNFPGQFKFLAPALVQQGHTVRAMTMRKTEAEQWHGVRLHAYIPARGSTPNVHPWAVDLETKIVRAEACCRVALKLKEAGFRPDVIVAFHGWGGESVSQGCLAGSQTGHLQRVLLSPTWC